MYNWIVKKHETAASINEAIRTGSCTAPEQMAAIAAAHGDEIFWAGSMPEGNKVMEHTDVTVTRVLREIGIPASILGYRYVREAIEMTVRDTSLINRVTKTIYPAIAEKFSATPPRVERAIRHAIESGWERGNPEALQKLFGNTISDSRGKPTNSEFIAMVADHITRGTV